MTETRTWTARECHLEAMLSGVLAVLDRPTLLDVAYAFGLVQQMPGHLSAEQMRAFLYGHLTVPRKQP